MSLVVVFVVTILAFSWSTSAPSFSREQTSLLKAAKSAATFSTATTAKEGFGPKKAHLTRDDLLVAIPSSSDRLPLVRGSRAWRKDVPSRIITEFWSDPDKLTKQAAFEGAKYEKYGEWREAWGCLKIGDVRAGVTPFLAAHLHGYDNFKWMLYGDDDTVFFIDNALEMLEGLDHNMPYFLTDNIWFPDQFDGRRVDHRKVHPTDQPPGVYPVGTRTPCISPMAPLQMCLWAPTEPQRVVRAI